MIILILGDTGAGKTSFAYAGAIIEMFNRNRMKQAKSIVFSLNAGGYKNLKLPDDHLVYTETFCVSRLFGHRPKISYLCSGNRFGLPNDKRETDFYPPCAYIVIDEGQKDVDSRNFKNLEDFVKRAWETNRHMLYDLVYVSQWGNVDKVLRKLANRILYIAEKGQKMSDGKYKHVQSFWKFLEFASYEEYEKWVESGQPKRAEQEFLFDGDITCCYDGFAYRPLWFKGREKADFTKIKNKPVEQTLQSFNEFLKNIGEMK